MARLIDADKLIEKLEALSDSYFDINCSDFTIGVRNLCRQQGVDAAIEVVKKQKPIDTVKHGHWIDTGRADYYLNKEYRCSCCDAVDYMRSNFCLNCGAKMDETR